MIAIVKIRPARLAQKADLFRFALFVFRVLVDVGIIIKDGDGKRLPERFQTSGRTGRAATVQQQAGALRNPFNNLAHGLVVIFFHGYIISPQRGFVNREQAPKIFFGRIFAQSVDKRRKTFIIITEDR